MLVRMTVGLAGATVAVPGDEMDFPDAEAVRLVEAGFAVPIAPKIERAIVRKVKEKR